MFSFALDPAVPFQTTLLCLSDLQAGALVHVYTDGSVLLTHGGTEMGQGLHTKMVQVGSFDHFYHH